MPTITEKIRAEFNRRREAREITYPEAASKLGVAVSTLHAFANGKDMLSERVHHLAAAIGMKISVKK